MFVIVQATALFLRLLQFRHLQAPWHNCKNPEWQRLLLDYFRVLVLKNIATSWYLGHAAAFSISEWPTSQGESVNGPTTLHLSPETPPPSFTDSPAVIRHTRDIAATNPLGASRALNSLPPQHYQTNPHSSSPGPSYFIPHTHIKVENNMASAQAWKMPPPISHDIAPFPSVTREVSNTTDPHTGLPTDFDWNEVLAGEQFLSTEDQHLRACDFGYSGAPAERGSQMKAMYGHQDQPWGLHASEGILHHIGGYKKSEAGTEMSSTSPGSLFSEFSDHEQQPFEGVVRQSAHNPHWVENGLPISSHVGGFSSGSIAIPSMAFDGSQPYFNHETIGMDFTGLPYPTASTSFSDYEMVQQSCLYSSSIPASFGPNVDDWRKSFRCEEVTNHAPNMWSHTDQLGPVFPPIHIEQSREYPRATIEIAANFPHHKQRFEKQIDPKSQAELEFDVAQSDNEAYDNKIATLRKKEDSILLEGKRAGLTYKEIKKKMRTDVAESTLRGRYRSLTKARKDRVRKPKWTEIDIRLLKTSVRMELDKLDDACYRQSTREQKLVKLSWKRVAEYIIENGGSYHFGNSTCKKKWAEIDPDR
ncbi:hypothetical protein B0J11DRAFT_505558 [Dendryphion nanum]|uniref:Myb-like domain-containing protein n=1 Tax=Dendryphion nanum TaxID=256645 RepID=A0A9P9DW47_9PLEO|nr:hypothetical protein B0J11DRAFT_505558 [Dendryphion nanum]